MLTSSYTTPTDIALCVACSTSTYYYYYYYYSFFLIHIVVPSVYTSIILLIFSICFATGIVDEVRY